jgi:transposase-like protein
VGAGPETSGPAQDLVPGVDYPRTHGELVAMFPDEAACVAYLERLRFPGGFACRSCGVAGEPWRASQGRVMCRSCRAATRLRAGTVFDKTRTPLMTWFAAAWYLTTAKNGLSAVTLERTLGVSYKVAWAMLQRYRVAMVRAERPRLSGEVEVDETFVGGVRRGQGRGRRAPGKAIVVIAVEVLDPVGYGRTRMRVVPSAAGADLLPFLRATIEPGSHLRTDGHRGYDGAVEAGFRRTAISIAASGDPAHVHLPAVHRVASLLKRWLLGTHQGAVNHDHLQTYLEEFTFRWNRRSSRSRGLLFRRLLEQAVATEPVTAEAVRHGYYRPPTPDPLGAGAVRVLVVEGSPVVAALLRADLAADGRFTLVTCTPDANLAVRQAGILLPDVVIVDAAHPAALRARLRKAAPAAALIVHDPHAADSYEHAADVDVVVATSDYRYHALAEAAARGGPAMPF